MDSLTQAVLGAAVAEAGMGGRRLGNKAAVWGAVIATLPDLDVVFFPWLDTVERLEWHRGISHSLAFMVVASPLLGWLVARVHRGRVGWLRAAWTVFWVLLTHVLVDVFTVYGTMVFAPFSDARVGLDNLFIIDPLFTLPLVVGLGVALCLRPDGQARRNWNAAGLALATLYACWSLGTKAFVDGRFRDSLSRQGIEAARVMSSPTPFNTVLWRCVARSGDDLWIGYYSLLDGNRPVRFRRRPAGGDLLESVSGQRVVERLTWFSNGFLSAREVPRGLLLADWRFGESPQASGDPLPIFAWKLVQDPSGEWSASSTAIRRDPQRTLGFVWKRIFDPGAEEALEPEL